MALFCQTLLQISQFAAVWQTSKPKQITGFFKRGVIGQFVNVDPAIGKNAAFAVDIANAGISGNDTFQAFRGRSTGHAGHNLSLNQIGYRCGSRARRCAGNATFIYTPKEAYIPDGFWQQRRLLGSESSRPDTQRCLAQDLLLKSFIQWQRPEFIKILLNVRHPRTRPIRTEQSLVRNLFETRKILEQALGRDPADVEIHVGMAANEKECGLHPERTPPMRQQDPELGKIDSDVVDIHRIAVLISCSRKDGCSRVKHYWN